MTAEFLAVNGLGQIVRVGLNPPSTSHDHDCEIRPTATETTEQRLERIETDMAYVKRELLRLGWAPSG